MKIMTRTLMMGAAALPIVGLATMSLASASTGITALGGRDTFVQNLATKFDLNRDDVAKFLDEQKATKEADIKQKATDALKSAGLTDSQITTLQARRLEQRSAMKAWHAANPNATRIEERSQREAGKTAIETWAKEQGVDLSKVQDELKTAGIGPFGGHMHGDRGGRMGMMESDTPPTDEPAAR